MAEPKTKKGIVGKIKRLEKERRKIRVKRFTGPSTYITKAISSAGKKGFKSKKGKSGARTYSVGGMEFKSARRTAPGKRKTTYGQTTGKVGRPAGTYSAQHINPATGKPMPAQAWYKLQRALKRRARAISEATDIQQTQALAKRGIPPEIALQIVDARQLRQAIRPQQHVQQVNPQQQINAELARIQQMEPWARQQAMRNLQRRVQVEQRNVNGGMTQQPQTAQRQEVSLMTGRTVVREDTQNKERWTR